MAFNALGLLAKLVDGRFQFKPDSLQSNVLSLGAQGVGLAVEFLREEIEPPSLRAAGF